MLQFKASRKGTVGDHRGWKGGRVMCLNLYLLSRSFEPKTRANRKSRGRTASINRVNVKRINTKNGELGGNFPHRGRGGGETTRVGVVGKEKNGFQGEGVGKKKKPKRTATNGAVQKESAVQK